MIIQATLPLMGEGRLPDSPYEALNVGALVSDVPYSIRRLGQDYERRLAFVEIETYGDDGLAMAAIQEFIGSGGAERVAEEMRRAGIRYERDLGERPEKAALRERRAEQRIPNPRPLP